MKVEADVWMKGVPKEDTVQTRWKGPELEVEREIKNKKFGDTQAWQSATDIYGN